MKKLLSIIVLGLLWCSISFAEYCTDDDKIHAEGFGNYYVPEEAYKFGLEIQEAVKNKDLDKLLSLIKDDLISGPKMSFFDNKTYDEAFPVTFRGAVLMNEPHCGPIGWRGFILGNGQIWYGKINHGLWDMHKDMMKHKWFSNLSRHDQIRILRDAGPIYGPWTITRITETK